MTPIDPVTDYAESVRDGKIDACKWVNLACARHLSDVENSFKENAAFKWDLDEAVRRIKICETMYHYQGPAKGTPFHVEPWEAFVIGSTFGWKVRKTGLRRFKYSFVKVPKKNGKTFLAVTVGTQMLMFGGQMLPTGVFEAEGGAEVYFVATKEDQAKKGWGDMVKVGRRSPGYSKRLTFRQKEIRHNESDGVCKPLGSDSDTLDGLNPSCVVKDELHAWKDRRLWDIMEDGFGARSQPIDFIITTEGTVRHSISDEIDGLAKSILSRDGGYEQDNFFAIIYTIDENDDPFDEKTWFKANPCLGVFGAKSLDYMRDQAAMARKMPSKFSTFMTKQLNVRMDVENRWLSMDLWDACEGVVNLEALKGCQCFAGMDLARSKDMSALALVFPDDAGGFDILMRYWIPEDEMQERIGRDRVPYDLWAREGLITATAGNVTDYGQIETEVAELAKIYPMQELAYDPMFATDLAMRLKDGHGLNPVDFVQTFKNYALPCKELERLLVSGKLRHGGHKVLRWNAGNAVVRVGPSGNQMPDKAKSSQRIDGISALLMALGRAVLKEAPGVGPGIWFQQAA